MTTPEVLGTTPDQRLADRFITSWKRLDQVLETRWRVDGTATGRASRPPTSDELLRWAERAGELPPSTAKFLQACRHARNAYAHVAFDGYEGPVTMPPVEVVSRLERVVSSLATPAKAGTVAAQAVTCLAETSVRDALLLMRRHDFSQLPYWLPGMGWVLVTREQISAWVEASAEQAGEVLIDLAEPVRSLAEHPAVRSVVPHVVPPTASVVEVLERLEQASSVDDAQPGGQPVVVVTRPDPRAAVRILTADDMPRLYDLLGR